MTFSYKNNQNRNGHDSFQNNNFHVEKVFRQNETNIFNNKSSNHDLYDDHLT